MKKLWRIYAVVTALCMMLTTVAFAAEAADDATTAEEPAATDEAAEGEEEPAADDTEEPVNTVVQLYVYLLSCRSGRLQRTQPDTVYDKTVYSESH